MPVTLKLGIRHPDVQTLRAALKARGYTPNYSVLEPSLFDAWVQAAVVDFQRKRGLTVDGIVGPNTWTALLGSPSQPVTVPGGVATPNVPATGPADPEVDVGNVPPPVNPPPVRLVKGAESSNLPLLMALAALGLWAWKNRSKFSAPKSGYGDHDEDDYDGVDEDDEEADFDGYDDVQYISDYGADEPVPPPAPAPAPAQKKEKKPKLTPEQKKAKEKARREAAEFKAEVDRQLAIERKRIRLDPLANPEQDARLRRRVEQSVRIQFRVPEDTGVDPRVRTRLELEEAIERATDDALAEKGLDVYTTMQEPRSGRISVPKTAQERDEKVKALLEGKLVEPAAILPDEIDMLRKVERDRIRALYARQGQQLPKGEGTYKSTNISHKIQSAAPVTVGAPRSRIPVARMEQGTASIRNLTAREEDQWLERVARAPTAHELDPSKPKRVYVDSKRWAKDVMYRQEMRDEAYADAKKRGTAAETHLVNERGVPLLKIKI